MILRARSIAREGDLGVVETELVFCVPTPLSKRAGETPVKRSFSSRLVPAPSEKEKDDRESGATFPADCCNKDAGLVAFMLAVR
jgi:hypothetical protein